MTQAQQQFLELLRAGLWGIPADPSHFQPEQTDWNVILRIAKEQTVQILVADGFETLPEGNCPPREAIMKSVMTRVKTKRAHHTINVTLNEIVNRLDAENIPSVLLKGQGVAKNYRNPESRICGDIDLYVGIEGHEKACAVIEKIPSATAHKEEEDTVLHMHIDINGVVVELHQRADFISSKRLNKRLQKWTRESIDANFGTDALETWDNNGTNIRLAPPTFTAFFILHHAVRHMIEGGIGLRQLCDWVMFLHTHYKFIDTVELSKKLKEFHMESLWKEFGIIAVTTLGLPAEELPLAPSNLKPTRKTGIILEEIFASGNFGKYKKVVTTVDPKTCYIRRKWRSFLIASKHLFRQTYLFSRHGFDYSIRWFGSAIVRFFKGDK